MGLVAKLLPTKVKRLRGQKKMHFGRVVNGFPGIDVLKQIIKLIDS